MTHADDELLTPERVRSAAFTPTRLGRRGLDEAEVRAFCEWVSGGLRRLLSDNDMLQAEILRLRERLLGGNGSGVRPEDAHVQAVHLLSRAQQTADRYVADAQKYSRELAVDARMRRDEIVREAKVRASMILEGAHSSATEAAATVRAASDQPHASEQQELQAELAYLRTFSEVCRTHLRAYLESLSRSMDEWERAERNGGRAAKDSAVHSEQHVLSPTAGISLAAKSKPRPFPIRFLVPWPLIRVAAGDRGSGRRGRVLADPGVLPGLVVLLLVAARPVDGGQLAGYLLAMGRRPARHLVAADVDLPPRSGAADPARRPRVPEREPLGGQVLGVADVDHRVVLRLGVGLRLVHDRVHRRRLRRRPAAEQPRAFERVAGE
jgi:DivIVA domain-containing protein